MILVTGGSFQGKRVFVRQYLGEQNADGAVWTEGAEASWEEFMDGRFCRDFHPQKVNAYQHVEHVKTHIPDNLSPFQSIDI